MNTTLFSRASLIEAAVDTAGTDALDLGPFAEPLSVLLDALAEEADLYPVRAWRTLDNLTEELSLRAAGAAHVADHPEILDRPVRAPVFIVGLPRTGTTLLHNLLSRVPGFHAWKLWELRHPVATDDRSEADLLADTQQVLEGLYSRVPAFRKIHPMQADWPDECSWLLRHAFSSLVWSFQYHVPSYRAWMCGHDQRPAYADYKRWLQILAARAPSGRLVLKDPCHLWHLDALLDTFPDATILHLHRDPAEALPSLASLCHSLHNMDAAQAGGPRAGAEVLALADAAVIALDRARAAHPKARIVDLDYRALVADPTRGLAGVLDTLGHSDADLSAPRAWLASNRQHRAGRHEYSPEMFGMKAEALRARFGGVL